MAGWVYRVQYYPATQHPARRPPRQPVTAGNGPRPRRGGLEAGEGDPFAHPEKYLKYSSFWDPGSARTHPASWARSVPLQGPSLVLPGQKGEIRTHFS